MKMMFRNVTYHQRSRGWGYRVDDASASWGGNWTGTRFCRSYCWGFGFRYSKEEIPPIQKEDGEWLVLRRVAFGRGP